MVMMTITEKQQSCLRWLPVAYLFTVAGFHFDGWYHAVVGRDQFWIAPHFFVMAGQVAATVLAYFFWRSIPAEEGTLKRYAGVFLFVELIFFAGLLFDESWHRIIGAETITTPLIFWGPPHAVIALSLLLCPFFLLYFIRRALARGEREFLLLLTCGTLFAFVDFYFQPFWPLGAFHVLGAYGETMIRILLGLVLAWSIHHLSDFPLAASGVTLSALSVKEIMSWGTLADIPDISSIFGSITAYPFWLTFFSFFISAVILDCVRSYAWPGEVQGALWGGSQSGLYAVGAKLWFDWSPHSFYPGWKAFPGVELSWHGVVLLAILGALGGAIGFLLVSFFQPITKKT